MGVGAYYILLKKSPTTKVENKTETEMKLRENTSERQILGSREAGQEVVYSDPETQEQNEDLTHSYCEVDDPINGTCVYTKPIASVSKEPIQLIPNKSRSYGESKKQRSRPAEEMNLKANLSYGEMGTAKRSGAKVKMEVNQSYILARENTDPDKRLEYDYVDSELFR